MGVSVKLRRKKHEKKIWLYLESFFDKRDSKDKPYTEALLSGTMCAISENRTKVAPFDSVM